MRKIVSFASTPNEAIKWSELGKYKRLSKEELYIYDFENIEEVHFIGSKKGENDYEIEETKWGIYINMEEAILLYICSWQQNVMREIPFIEEVLWIVLKSLAYPEIRIHTTLNIGIYMITRFLIY